jgi:4-hydroxybenzoate polyprenyltransferase
MDANAHPKQVAQAAKFSRAVFWSTIICRSLRLHQWAKNVLIFVPLVLGGKGGQSAAWLNALTGFLALGFAASSTYIFNDLHDLPNDRKHRSKRIRPLANGDISIQFGMVLAIASLIAGFVLAAYAGLGAFAMLAVYVALSLSYSFYWKRVPILDAFVLAVLFTSRLGIGVALTHVRLSLWLFIFSMFIFTSLSMAKRNTEVLASTGTASTPIPGRGYVSTDAPLILALGMGTGISAVLVMILYLIEDAYPRQFYANPAFLWALPAMLFLFLGRVWLLSERGQMHDDPVAFALKDRASLLLGLLMSLALAASFIKFGPI